MSKQVREAEVNVKKKFYDSALPASAREILSIHQMQNNIEMGDTRLCPAKGIIFAGLGATTDSDGNPSVARTSAEAHKELEAITGIPVVKLKLKGDYYHLDTAFCPLPDGHAMVYEPAFEPESLERLQQILGKDKIISISKTDVEAFAANSFVIHHNIFMPQGVSSVLQQRLTSIGYDVYLHEIEAPKMSGGGHNCMTDCLSQIIVEGGYVPKSLEEQLAKKQGRVYEVIATPGHGFGEDYAVFATNSRIGSRMPATTGR